MTAIVSSWKWDLLEDVVVEDCVGVQRRLYGGKRAS